MRIFPLAQNLRRFTTQRRFSPSALGFVESLEPRLLLATYYVDSVGGNDQSNGTTSPWASLAKVNSVTFQPGDQILFKAGDEWTGQLKPHGAGTSTNWITIDQYGAGSKPLFLGTGQQATLTYSSDGWNGMTQYWDIRDLAFSGGGAAVEILNGSTSDMHGVHLEDLDISRMGTMGYSQGNGAIWVFGWAGPIDDVLIANNTITDVGSCGIWVQGANNNATPHSTNVVVIGNTIERPGLDGIEVDYAVNPLVSSNSIDSAGLNGPPGQAPQVIFIGMFLLMCEGGTVEHNEVANTAASLGGDSQAFDLDNGNSGIFYFQYNYSHNNAGGFMETTTSSLLNPTDQCVVRYNISQNDGNVMGPQQGAGLFRVMGQHLLVYNNTFYNGFGPNVVQKWYSDGKQDASFENNIFASPDGFISEVNNQGPATNPFFYDHNLFSGGSGPANSLNSITADPRFVSPGSGGAGFASLGGYQLMAGSAAAGAGVPIAQNGGLDFLGNPLIAGAPTIGAIQLVVPAVAQPPTVTLSSTGRTALLTVLGADAAGESKLTYTWATSAVPTPGIPMPTFSANGTNAAKNSTVTFYRTGSYTLTVTIRAQDGLATTSQLFVTVGQVLTRIVVAAPNLIVSQGQTQQLAATGIDQYGQVFASPPTFSWSVTGGGTVSKTGLYTAPGTTTSAIATATSGSVTGQVTLTVLDATPRVAQPATVTLSSTGRTALLTVLGADAAGESKLTYTWATSAVPTPGIPMPTFSANGTNTAKNSTVTFYRTGSYTLTVTIRYSASLSITTSVTILVV